MKIDAHAHGMHAPLDHAANKSIPPVVPAWSEQDGSPAEHIRKHRELGIEQVVLLGLSEELRLKIDRENILKLLKQK